MSFNSREINHQNSPFLKGQKPVKEPGVFFGPAIINQVEKKFSPSRRFFIWFAITFIVLFYLIWGVIHLFAPPKITIYEPTDNYVTTEKIINVKGRVSEKSLVLINNQIVNLDEKNYFEEKITLIEGVNVITVSARKKIGGQSETLRQIIVK